MDGKILNDPTMSMMYENALQALYAGNVMPFDRQILALAPLPDDVVDPYAAQDVDPNRIMQFTYQSLSAWIDEAKKANYLSKHFTDLSKLILKGVNTMGRGLITLHNRGEDLSRAPMQIGDLISVASYHFRKSYLGVMQTSAVHPEISERLLLNQLSWTKMLLRLYKTKDKLEKPVSIKQLQAERIEGKIETGKLPDGEFDHSLSPVLHSSVENGPAFSGTSENPFSDVDALFEPSALSAPRALSSFDSRKQAALCVPENLSPVTRNQEQKNAPVKRNQIDEEKQTMGSGIRENESIQKNGEEIKTPEYGKPVNGNEPPAPEREENVRNKDEENPEYGEPETGDEIPAPEREENVRNKDEENPENVDPEPGNELRTPEKEWILRNINEEKPETWDPETGNEIPDPGDELRTEAERDPDDGSYHDSEDCLPPYLNIMQNVFARGQDPENGSITFTEYEMLFLAADPDFNRFYPETAAEFRRILSEHDST